MAEQFESSHRHNWLHSLPAFIGLALGGIYALGAISVFGQVYAADVSPSQMLGLVPLEQMLARGIASLITPAVYLTILFLVFYGLGTIIEVILTKRKEDTEQKPAGKPEVSPPSSRLVTGFKRFDQVLARNPVPRVLIPAFLIAVMAPPLILATLALSFLGGICIVIAVSKFNDWGSQEDWDKVFITWMVSIMLMGSVIGSFLLADPLPNTSLLSRSGKCVRGELVLDTGDTWYIKTENEHVTAVPARNVQVAHVHFLERPPELSALDVLMDRAERKILGEVRGVDGTDAPRPCE